MDPPAGKKIRIAKTKILQIATPALIKKCRYKHYKCLKDISAEYVASLAYQLLNEKIAQALNTCRRRRSSGFFLHERRGDGFFKLRVEYLKSGTTRLKQRPPPRRFGVTRGTWFADFCIERSEPADFNVSCPFPGSGLYFQGILQQTIFVSAWVSPVDFDTSTIRSCFVVIGHRLPP